jgi:hypothetical protein
MENETKGGKSMKHARKDYQERIQDSAGIIPADEPVFLLRGQDKLAPGIVDEWATQLAMSFKTPYSKDRMAMVQAARGQAKLMREWQEKHGSKIPDMPKGAGQ